MLLWNIKNNLWVIVLIVYVVFRVPTDYAWAEQSAGHKDICCFFSPVSIVKKTPRGDIYLLKGLVFARRYLIFPYHLLFPLEEAGGYKKGEKVSEVFRLIVVVSGGRRYFLTNMGWCDALRDVCVGKINGTIRGKFLADNYTTVFSEEKVLLLNERTNNFIEVLSWKNFGRILRWFQVKSHIPLVPGSLLWDPAGRVVGMIVFSSDERGFYWVLPFEEIYKHFISNYTVDREENIWFPLDNFSVDPADYSLICGVSFYLDGDFTGAVRSFHRAVHGVSSGFLPYFGLGLSYMAMGEYNTARKYLKRALKFNPSSPEGYFNLALANNALGFTDEACVNFQRVIHLNSKFRDTYYYLALIMGQKGEFNTAREYFDKAISLQPDDADVYYDYGVLCGSMGMYNEAKKYLEKAKILYRRKNNEKALQEISNLLAVFP